MDQDKKENIHPLTGQPFDEEAERSRLVPIEQDSTPSKETQEAFKKFVKEEYGTFPKKRIIPDKLFYALEMERDQHDYFSRAYHKADSEDFNRGEYAGIEFTKSHGTLSYLIVAMDGEQRSNVPYEERDRTLITFTQFDPIDTLLIQSTLNSRVLKVTYSQNGELEQITFNSGLNWHQEADIWFGSDDLKKLKSSNKPQDLKVRQSDIVIGFDKESNRFSMERRENGKLLDKLAVPQNLELNRALDELLSEELLNNPLNAALEEDTKWKHANFRSFGISWERN